MAHPRVFGDDDPNLPERALAGAPAAAEKVSHGRPAFFTTKAFAYYGGSLKAGGPARPDRTAVVRGPSVDHERGNIRTASTWRGQSEFAPTRLPAKCSRLRPPVRAL